MRLQFLTDVLYRASYCYELMVNLLAQLYLFGHLMAVDLEADIMIDGSTCCELGFRLRRTVTELAALTNLPRAEMQSYATEWVKGEASMRHAISFFDWVAKNLITGVNLGVRVKAKDRIELCQQADAAMRILCRDLFIRRVDVRKCAVRQEKRTNQKED